MSELRNVQSSGDPVVRYLLGESLPGDREAEIEERYFADDSYLDFILSVEDALIDDYIHGGLSAEQRALFEGHFLASQRRREKWEAQRAIASFFRSPESRPELAWWRRFLNSGKVGFWVAGFAALLAVVAFLGWTDARLSSEVRSARSQLSSLGSRMAVPAVVVFSISPGRLRSGPGDAITVPAKAEWIDLRAALPGTESRHASYTATLTTPENEEIWKQGRLTGAGNYLAVRLPASLLAPGDYIFTLSGIDGTLRYQLPAYQFRIQR